MRREPELIIDPGRGPYRPDSKLKQVLRVVVAIAALAAVIGMGFLLLAGLFTILAFVLPVLLVAAIIFVLVNRRRVRTIIVRRG